MADAAHGEPRLFVEQMFAAPKLVMHVVGRPWSFYLQVQADGADGMQW